MKPLKFQDLILQETEDYLIINKPPHVSALEDRDKTQQTILGLARNYCETAQLCHRLDKETSGILAIAKNPTAYRHLALQFEKRKVAKIYHAVTWGIHDFKGVKVELPIRILNKGIVKIDKFDGKPAETIFNTLKAYKSTSLVECRPITGRMHQIRIHLACLKASILADVQYGGKLFYLSQLKKKRFNLKRGTEEQPLIKRVALHAQALVFEELNGKTIQVEAPYPKDIRALLRQLENYQ